MHDKSLRLPGLQDMAIRTITPDDLEKLRTWKNAHQMFFFHQQEIQPLQQLQWYAGYLQRADDYMFIVEAEGQSIGCMGIRLLVDGWDVYNVILGATELTGRGLMGRAFQLMLRFARERRQHPIKLKVLKQNPAIGWYQKNGFHIMDDGGDHFVMLHSAAPAIQA
jgi:RimJ/RimL family protein N-acetyltransferase